MKNILVVGAAKPLGLEIVKRLLAKGFSVVATYRHSDSARLLELTDDNLKIEQLDLNDGTAAEAMIARADGVIFTPILTVCEKSAKSLRKDARAIFLSSNNVTIDPEAPVYAALLQAERGISQIAPQATILRPTMIYGYPGDGNLSRLMTFVKRFRFSPIFGSGEALQQPVFYRDLAGVAVDALLNGHRKSELVAVGGPDAVSLKQLHLEVVKATCVRAIAIGAPLSLVRPAVRAIEKIGVNAPLSTAQIARAETDKIPIGAVVQLGSTTLENGLKSLAASLDATERGA
ncbi:MAG: SDR family NAD(P)-dependent oxidoreductase [Marinicaulis sp.]|nr:SDR family NAD(P)-dependent oxidoreductase [Marinicaulis sp.]